MTRLIIANAIYLHADWQSPFEKEATQPRVFHAPDGDIEVPTMALQEHLQFAHDIAGDLEGVIEIGGGYGVFSEDLPSANGAFISLLVARPNVDSVRAAGSASSIGPPFLDQDIDIQHRLPGRWTRDRGAIQLSNFLVQLFE